MRRPDSFTAHFMLSGGVEGEGEGSRGVGEKKQNSISEEYLFSQSFSARAEQETRRCGGSKRKQT